MTRSYLPRRTRPIAVRHYTRDPSITRLGFTMYRLEPYQAHAPDEAAFVPVQVINSRNAMSALVDLR